MAGEEAQLLVAVEVARLTTRTSLIEWLRSVSAVVLDEAFELVGVTSWRVHSFSYIEK